MAASLYPALIDVQDPVQGFGSRRSDRLEDLDAYVGSAATRR